MSSHLGQPRKPRRSLEESRKKPLNFTASNTAIPWIALATSRKGSMLFTSRLSLFPWIYGPWSLLVYMSTWCEKVSQTVWNSSKTKSLSLQRKYTQKLTLPACSSGLNKLQFNQGCIIMCKLNDVQLNLRHLNDLRFGRASNIMASDFTRPGGLGEVSQALPKFRWLWV